MSEASTAPAGPLSAADLAAYREHGFTVARGLVPQADLDRYVERLSQIVSGEVAAAPDMLVMKDVMVVKGAVEARSEMEAIAKLQDYEQDPVLDGYVRHSAVLDCVEQIVGERVMSIHTMLINKPPNVDGRHPLHQDLLYFPFRPADRIVASWTALERVTRENGCLVVIPGSHKGEVLQHGNPDWEHLNGGYFGVRDVSGIADERVHLEMEPGDTVFFHPILLHGSGRNKTQGFRRAISAHYASADCTWNWKSDELPGRHYRIVRGEGSGGEWHGERGSGEKIDPLDYLRAVEQPFGGAKRKAREKAREAGR